MANALTKYRHENGLTLDAFAQQLGTRRAQVWKWEHGAFPRPEWLIKIQKATGGQVTANDFVPDEAAS